MPVPPVLLVCPPPIRSPQGTVAPKFAGAEERCAGLADAYRTVAATLECHFFDSSDVVSSSPIDGVHLDSDQHVRLGQALVDVVAPILG
jgi:lysophospholipase L1-like esterase